MRKKVKGNKALLWQMVIPLKRPDLSIQGSTYCVCSVVLALSSPLQPQPFSGSPLSSLRASAISHLQFAPVWPNRWKKSSYCSFTTDSISNSQPGLLCGSRQQRGAHVLLTSASAHTPPRQAGSHLSVFAWPLLTWAVPTWSASLSAGRAVSSEGYLCLIGSLYTSLCFCSICLPMLERWWDWNE